MSQSLPAAPRRARSITGVVSETVAALDGRAAWLPAARSAIVVVLDGLGIHQLRARAGHARFLSAAATPRAEAVTVFPSTTAAALTSLLTGVDPGTHGIVGYRVRVPGTDRVPDQLHGWETDGLDPEVWQRAAPIVSRESSDGRPCTAILKPAYRGSGFTAATLRGARIETAERFSERARIAAESARTAGSLTYLYAPDLDSAGHREGWQSDRWTRALEEVDAVVRDLVDSVDGSTGVIVTADHGMVDVPAHRHVLLRAGDPLLADVEAIGGEPRMLHLYTAEGRAEAVRDVWTATEGERAWILSREDALDAGLFGATDADVVPRIGDVIVAARSAVAYYDDRVADKRPQSMVGQHGSLTDEERRVPLLRFGAFAV